MVTLKYPPFDHQYFKASVKLNKERKKVCGFWVCNNCRHVSERGWSVLYINFLSVLKYLFFRPSGQNPISLDLVWIHRTNSRLRFSDRMKLQKQNSDLHIYCLPYRTHQKFPEPIGLQFIFLFILMTTENFLQKNAHIQSKCTEELRSRKLRTGGLHLYWFWIAFSLLIIIW